MSISCLQHLIVVKGSMKNHNNKPRVIVMATLRAQLTCSTCSMSESDQIASRAIGRPSTHAAMQNGTIWQNSLVLAIANAHHTKSAILPLHGPFC